MLSSPTSLVGSSHTLQTAYWILLLRFQLWSNSRGFYILLLLSSLSEIHDSMITPSRLAWSPSRLALLNPWVASLFFTSFSIYARFTSVLCISPWSVIPTVLTLVQSPLSQHLDYSQMVLCLLNVPLSKSSGNHHKWSMLPFWFHIQSPFINLWQLSVL